MKGKKFLSMFIMFILLVNVSPSVTLGAVSKPSLQIVAQPKASYSRGETITFTVNAPNYSGKVEYRVILYNGTTKKTTNLWNTPGTGYYYRKWQPAGTYKFAIKWSATQLEPGAYSLTVLARRANTKGSYDSFVKTKSFYVTGGTSISTPSNLSLADAGSQEELERAIKASILRCDEELQVYFKDIYINYDSTAIFKAVEASIKKTLDEDIDINYIKSYYIQGSELSNTYKITYAYRYPRETALAQYQEATRKAAEVVNEIIKPDMTQLQREIAIHNYIVNNTRYDKYNYDKGTIPDESYTSYGVLVKGVAVCQGYAIAMNKLLKLAGIENIIITGNGNGVDHAWNLVKLEDSWYHIDATWDDPLTINDVTKNNLSFDYFNLSDTEMSKDHTWDITKYPKCIDTKYRYAGN